MTETTPIHPFDHDKVVNEAGKNPKSKLDHILYEIACLQENSVGDEQWDTIEYGAQVINEMKPVLDEMATKEGERFTSLSGQLEAIKILMSYQNAPVTDELSRLDKNTYDRYSGLYEILDHLRDTTDRVEARLGSLPSEHASEHKTLVTMEELREELSKLFGNLHGTITKGVTVTSEARLPEQRLNEIRETIGRDVRVWIKEAVAEATNKKVQVEIGEKIAEHKKTVTKTYSKLNGSGIVFFVTLALCIAGFTWQGYTDPVSMRWTAATHAPDSQVWATSGVVGLLGGGVVATVLAFVIPFLYKQATRPFRWFWNLLSTSIKPNDCTYHYDGPTVWGITSLAGFVSTLMLLVADTINLPDLIDAVVYNQGPLCSSWTSTDIVQTFWYAVPHLLAVFGWMVTYLICKKRPEPDTKPSTKIEGGESKKT